MDDTRRAVAGRRPLPSFDPRIRVRIVLAMAGTGAVIAISDGTQRYRR